MTSQPDRRTVLKLAAAAALAAATTPSLASSTTMDGIVTFEGGKAIPEGSLVVYLEDPGIADRALRRVAETRFESDGKSTSLAFVLSPPANLVASATLQLVARLERADGWLLARGSAQLEPGTPAAVTLNAAMY